MNVLLHFPSLHDVPEGVWWVDDEGRFQEHYVPGSALRPRGVLVMGTMWAGASAEDVFNSLAEGHSYFDVWARVEVSENSTPQETLDLMRKTIETEKKTLQKRAAQKRVI